MFVIYVRFRFRVFCEFIYSCWKSFYVHQRNIEIKGRMLAASMVEAPE